MKALYYLLGIGLCFSLGYFIYTPDPSLVELYSKIKASELVLQDIAGFTAKAEQNIQTLAKMPGDKKTQLSPKSQTGLELSQHKFISSCTKKLVEEIAAKEDNVLRYILGDREWLQGFLASGPLPHPELALTYLEKLYQHDKEFVKNNLYKKLATATALEFARGFNPKKANGQQEWSEEKMYDRYDFYREGHAQKMLNAQFDKLNYWDMRILAGCKMGSWGEKKSLEWQRENLRLPAENYVGACWTAPYRLFNAWGESIHGRDYYKPFAKDIFSGQAEMTMVIGGVCGGLSHFGAFAALANGIPAMTMGEPGHCAYTVRTTTENWSPAYSLSWKRGAHWNYYGPKWSLLMNVQKTLSNVADANRANELAWLAQEANKVKNPQAAKTNFEEALKIQPDNYSVWISYLNWMKENPSSTIEDWQYLHSKVCDAFSQNYPEIAWMVLQQHIYPQLMPLLKTPEAKALAFSQFHQSLKKMTPITWDFADALKKQKELLGGKDDAMKGMLNVIINHHLNSPDYGPTALAWCQENVAKNPALQQDFISKVSVSKDGMDKNAFTSFVSTLMNSAEGQSDLDTFQAAGKMMNDQFKPSLPKYEPFPGEMLSSGGMLQLSSNYDTKNSWRHWGVLEPTGGAFHTKNGEKEWAKVTLKGMVDISGIVILSVNNQNDRRANGAIIECSTDGNSWQQIGTLEQCKSINRIDCSSSTPRAKYVRISLPGKNFLHFKGIHIYGKKAS